MKVFATVSNITIYINAIENNLGKPTGFNSIETFIKQKFSGQEIRMVDFPLDADYVIEAVSDTQEDISSPVLEKNYSIKLASLVINLSLRNRISNEVLYKGQVGDLYGYANVLEKAGLNAYENPKLKAKLGESVFFLKRKILVY